MIRKTCLAWLLLVQLACAHTQTSVPGVPGQGLSTAARADYQFLLYEQYVRQDNWEKAREALRKAIELKPSPQLYLELANTAWQENDPETARSILKSGIEHYPDYLGFYRSLASLYLAENRMEQAAVTLEQYYTAHSEDVQVIKELAAILIKSENFPRAKDILNSYPREHYDAQLFYLLGKACSGLGLRSKAIEHLTAATTLNPEYIDAWVELGYLYELERDYSAAEATYQWLIELGESSQQVWLRLITLNLKLNNPDKALAIATDVPLSREFQVEVGNAFLSEGFYAQAQAIIDLLKDQEGSSAQIDFMQSLLYLEKDDDPQRALAALRNIPADDPMYKQILEFRTHLLLQLDQPDEAAGLVEQAKSMYPEESTFWLLDAAVAEHRQEYQAAQEILDRGLSRFPENTDLLYRKGILFEKQDQRETALETMEEVIRLDPDYTDALNFLGYTLADQGTDLDRALVLIKSAAQNAPENGYIIDSLAWVYFKRGDLDSAWREIQKAVSLVESDPIIWEHYGDIAYAMQKPAKARDAYRKALELQPNDPAIIQSKLDRI